MTRINELHLKGFRCWEDVHWSPSGDVHLLIGANGVGKTSILEAIYIAAQMSPPQGVRWRELIPQGGETGFVAATIDQPHGEEHIRVGFDRQERRLRVDGKAPWSVSAYAHNHPVVFFRPGDLALVQGAPKGRRGLLDDVAASLFAGHHDALSRYQQALSARNSLLRPQGSGGDLMQVWSSEAARYGAQVMHHRAQASAALAEHVQPAYSALCASSETLVARYRPCVDDHQPAEALLRLWASQLERDRRSGYTGAGPHSEDWELRLDGRHLRHRASQGQQRSAVLACRLAQVELIAAHNTPPILLLDDIAGELDDQRAARLFERLLKRSGQAFVTATRELGEKMPKDVNMSIYEVSKGHIEPIDS